MVLFEGKGMVVDPRPSEVVSSVNMVRIGQGHAVSDFRAYWVYHLLTMLTYRFCPVVWFIVAHEAVTLNSSMLNRAS